MDRWYVVYTQPRAEEQALEHLEKQGFRCFLPRLRRVKSHARRKTVGLVPLFPRYLFTRLDGAREAWRSVNGTRGVVHLLTNGHEPAAVAGDFVGELISASDERGVASPAALGMLWKGRTVCIQDGPLSGQMAAIDEVGPSGSERVALLLSLLGKATRFDLPAYAVEPA